MLDRYINELERKGNSPPLSASFLNVHELAEEEARRFNHHYFGKEHQWLGLMRQGANGVLADFGINLNASRARVERVMGKGWAFEGSGGGLIMTPRAQRVITLSIEAADLLRSSELDSEHVLLGLIAEAQEVANKVHVPAVLERGLDLELIREVVLRRKLPDYKPQNLNILLNSIL